MAPGTRSPGGALAVGAGILLSRLFGLVRQRVIAHFLGVGHANDVLSAALRIPNVVQNLLGEGVLSASFVPVYARLRAEGRHDDAARVARAVFALLSMTCAIVVLAGMVFTPWLVTAIAAGFPPEKRAATVTLVRILFPGMGVLVVSAWCLGILNAHRQFFVGYAAPIAWNVAIIAALLMQGSVADPERAAWLVAVGSVIGSVLQVAVQLPWLMRVLPRAAHAGRASVGAEVQTVVRNFGPVVVGRGAVQVSAWIDQLIASLVSASAAGAAGVLFYAQNIALLPVSVFGMSIAVSELTEMAGQAEGDIAATIRARLVAALRRIAFFIVPSAVGFLVLGDVVASALLETGRFGRRDAVWVWAVLAGASVGLLAGTMGRVYSSAWYALHDTRTPLRFALVRIGVSAALGAFCALVLPGLLGIDSKWGVAGLTVSGSVGAWIEYALLRRALTRRIGAGGLPAGLLTKLWGAALAAGALGFAGAITLPVAHPVALGVLVLGLYGVAYFALTSWMGIPEAAGALDSVRARLGRRRT